MGTGIGESGEVETKLPTVERTGEYEMQVHKLERSSFKPVHASVRTRRRSTESSSGGSSGSTSDLARLQGYTDMGILRMYVSRRLGAKRRTTQGMSEGTGYFGACQYAFRKWRCPSGKDSSSSWTRGQAG
jgi:hypothetical protein